MIENRSILLNKKYASPPHPPPPEKINVEITLTCLLREPQFVECDGDRGMVCLILRMRFKKRTLVKVNFHLHHDPPSY